MLAHGAVPNARYLLLVLPDRLYLWKNAGNTPDLVEPTYEINAEPFFRPYFESAGVSPPRLTPEAFELIVTAWLNCLVHLGIPKDLPEEQRQVLEESGLIEAIRGGSVAVEVRAINVYVETNFILELAFLQEEHENCEKILDICRSRAQLLVIPAFCLAESYEKVARQVEKRRVVASGPLEELRQLSRSKGKSGTPAVIELVEKPAYGKHPGRG